MDMTQPSSSLGIRVAQRKGVLAIAILVALVVTYGVLLARPFEYQATVQLLIIQQQSENQDLLSTLRATEQVGKSLVDVISTSTFFEKVLATDFPITRTFSEQPEQRRAEWRTAVRASIAQQSGIITVSVYDPNRDQAAIIARAIADVLTRESQEFHGKSNIIVKVVDDVYTRRWPVKPNLVGSTLAALFFGTLAGIALISVLPPARRPRREHPTADSRGATEPASPQPARHLSGRPESRSAGPEPSETTKHGTPPAGLAIDGEVDEG